MLRVETDCALIRVLHVYCESAKKTIVTLAKLHIGSNNYYESNSSRNYITFVVAMLLACLQLQ